MPVPFSTGSIGTNIGTNIETNIGTNIGTNLGTNIGTNKGTNIRNEENRGVNEKLGFFEENLGFSIEKTQGLRRTPI